MKKKSLRKKVKKLLPKKKTKRYHHMYLYVIIVNFGLSDWVLDALEENNSNMQVVIPGTGTASKEILRMVGLEDQRKDVILAFVDEKEVKNIRIDLDKLFLQKKKFMGMGFAVQMSSVVGEKIYKFLSNTI